HICGKMHKVYQELNKIRTVAHSFDSIVSIKEAKKVMPGKVMIGNVSSFALEFADADRIRVLTQKVMDDGSDIIAPACGLGTKSSLENIQAMLHMVQQSSREA
nr:methylcobamide--CoM methyltransferase [Desulfitobacterium hafniense]